MKRCDLLPEDCVADHIAPRMDGRRGKGDQWSARCPSHRDQKRSLSITVGTDQRIVWNCWAGCSASDVKKAMLAGGVSPRCVPWTPSGVHAESERNPSEDVLVWLEELISRPLSGNEFRLRAGMRVWDTDALSAATKLGFSERTYYRYRPK